MVSLARTRGCGACAISGASGPVRPWLFWSLLGMGWGVAHVGMEMLMGLGLLKVGTLLTLLWALAFVPAVRGSIPARYAAVALGALASFYLALVHFIRLNMHLAWLGPLPILMRDEVAG